MKIMLDWYKVKYDIKTHADQLIRNMERFKRESLVVEDRERLEVAW